MSQLIRIAYDDDDGASFYATFFYSCNIKNFNGADYFACHNEALVTGHAYLLRVML